MDRMDLVSNKGKEDVAAALLGTPPGRGYRKHPLRGPYTIRALIRLMFLR
jgi:hypothetical protein